MGRATATGRERGLGMRVGEVARMHPGGKAGNLPIAHPLFQRVSARNHRDSGPLERASNPRLRDGSRTPCAGVLEGPVRGHARTDAHGPAGDQLLVLRGEFEGPGRRVRTGPNRKRPRIACGPGMQAAPQVAPAGPHRLASGRGPMRRSGPGHFFGMAPRPPPKLMFSKPAAFTASTVFATSS